MKCQENYDLVGYFNKEVIGTEHSEIEKHLSSCSDCQRELADIKKTVLSLMSLPEIEPSSDFTTKVISRVETEYSRLTQPSLVIPEQKPIPFLDIFRYYLRRSPPWAISTALHIILFAILTFIFVNQSSKSFNPDNISYRWIDVYLPKTSDIQEPQSVNLQGAVSTPEITINQKELVNRILQGDDKIIKHIVGRVDETMREELLAKYNGKETVMAVSQGMGWLVDRQEEEGNWSPGKYGGRDEYTVALTGLATLCFTAQGNSHLQGAFSESTNRAVKYLISVQEPNGLLTTPLPENKPANYMYNHGIATYALLEDYLIAQNYPESESDELTRQLGKSIVKAVSFIVQAQSDNGGWGYVYRSPLPDTSVTVWQIQALRLASILDIPGVDGALYKSRQWLQGVTSDNGFVGYQAPLDYPNGPYALTAAGTTAYMWIDSLTAGQTDYKDAIKERLDGLSKKQIALLSENPPGPVSQGISTGIDNDFYYWYWGTLAMFSTNNPEWEKWNTKTKNILLENQSGNGSWILNDCWSVYGGELYTTTMAILTLQVYYRYPPRT